MTRKMTNVVARISLGQQSHIDPYELWSKRDGGYADDFVLAPAETVLGWDIATLMVANDITLERSNVS
ncbi:GDP-D-mannose dehydratase [Demequina lutea]|uniref:GDP-D-mannose dehydratase n=1 Tax=Demequina lutea TaxID=431489 RepID=A0A7Z0CH42_9MICO|nr:GDP-D-mannose dehydratase [Demequina lutea]